MIELLVAILIMLIGIIATLSLVSTSMKTNTRANQLTTKTALGQQMMEDLLSLKDLPVEDPPATYPYNLNITDSDSLIAAGAGTYSATYATTQIEPAAPAEKPFLVRIDIKVTPVTNTDESVFESSAYRYLE